MLRQSPARFSWNAVCVRAIYGKLTTHLVRHALTSQKPEAAEDAIEKGGELIIGGRKCRVEPAKVPSKTLEAEAY